MVIIFPNLMLAAAVNALIRSRVDEFTLDMYQSTGLELFKNKILFDYMIVMGVLTLVSWPTKARLIRGQMLSLREREFIRAEQAMGATGWYIIWRHLGPKRVRRDDRGRQRHDGRGNGARVGPQLFGVGNPATRGELGKDDLREYELLGCSSPPCGGARSGPCDMRFRLQLPGRWHK